MKTESESCRTGSNLVDVAPVLLKLGFLFTLFAPLQQMDQQAYLAYTTHHRHQATIQALFNFAVEQQHIKANPIAKLKWRKPDIEKDEHASDETIRYLTPDQIKQMYQAVETDCRTHAIVRLLHCSGAWISEVLALDLKQVDLKQQKFKVVGKGNKQRWCFYSDDAAQVLTQYRATSVV